MTCIVGLETEDGAVLGGDSAAAGSNHIHQAENEKVFRVPGGAGVGYTTSFRMGQILKRDFEYSPPRNENLIDNFIEEAIPEVREFFDEAGYLKEDSKRESGGIFLVAAKGKLLKVQKGFGVIRSSRGYDAIGSGFKQALGSLHTTENFDVNPKQRVEMALEAAAHSGKSVSPPFTIKSFGYELR